RCRNDCSKYTQVPGASLQNMTDMCEADSFCDWNATSNTCVSVCQYSTQAQCNADATCMWDARAVECKKTCGSIDTVVECGVNFMCIWDTSSTVCKKRCEFRHLSETGCTGDQQCIWDGDNSVCRRSCSLLQTSNDCGSNALCEWMADSNVCKTRCSFFNQTMCATDTLRCNWQLLLDQDQVNSTFPMGCRKRCGMRYATATASTCNNDANCMYDVNDETCTKTCRRYDPSEYPTMSKDDVNALCLKNKMCDIENGPCTLSCQNRYTQQSSCEEDEWCMWDNIRNYCTKKCDTIKTTDACIVSPTCEWIFTSATNGTCKLQCQYRFVGAENALACDNDGDCRWN
ncbi:MAG: hypothetical protein Q8J97_15905, partial [Flavobacteriaceae bacterium]|nr:hypothetical protein [Flavobacteriaceae bacterium]